MIARRKIVGVMGSGSEEHAHLAEPLGVLIARRGWNLLTGGGAGVMASVARAYVAEPRRDGICIGILPTVRDGADLPRPLPGYPNPWIEVAINSALGRFDPDQPNAPTRNHANIATSDAIVALPGDRGTRHEISLARDFARPIALFDPDEVFAELDPALTRATTIREVIRFLDDHLSKK